MSAPTILAAAARLAALRRALDLAVVGQDEAKTGLMLALVAREHAYLEGPAGCGKSLLAATLAAATGARIEVVAFHRDIREVDLLGDAVLRRRALPGRGERLEREVAPGPLLAAEIALLEDLPRAPGEALGPLLRILAERRALSLDLPLETAIATAPPQDVAEAEGAPIDPLEPSQLDRFAVQVRLRGLLVERRWPEVRLLLDRSADRIERTTTAVLDAQDRRAAQRLARGIAIPAPVRRGYEAVLARLRRRAGLGQQALLSDRAFGRTVWSLVRAHALVRGADEAALFDLRALRYMVGRRLPDELQHELEALIEELIADRQTQVAAAGSETVGGPAISAEGAMSDQLQGAAAAADEDERFHAAAQRAPPRTPAQVDVLLRALVGRIDRGRVDPDSDPGGQPRSYRPLRQLDELFDGDLVEALLFSEGCLPGKPRTYDRQRRSAGGAVVILRDVSASMAGRLAEWAGQVVAGVVRVAARRRMRVGYVEFHHRALDYPVAGRLLHRAYGHLHALAAETRTLGQTNYEAPLRLALEGLRGGTGRNRHVVMLTDGLPILGDPTVKRERALAKRLGVSLHTVFLGSGDCPPVLDELSRETQGLRFQARPGTRGELVVAERDAA